MGGTEYRLIEQGKLLTSDKRIYIAGSISTSGICKIGVGSPNPVEHSILPESVVQWPIAGQIVYTKIFGRILNGGSFVGEQ